jgi:Tfp pilus assembly protein PilE
MKKIMAFVIGLLVVPFGFTWLIMAFVPPLWIALTAVIVIVGRRVYNFLINKKPVSVLTSSGISNPKEITILMYKYENIGVKLSFLAGLLTSYLLATASNSNSDGTWLKMAVIFLPVYIFTIFMIVTALIVISKITDKPDWILEQDIEKIKKKPILLIAANVVSIIALVCIPVITTYVHNSRSQELEKISNFEDLEKERERETEEAEKYAERQKNIDLRATQQEAQKIRFVNELESSALSSNWNRFIVKSSPEISFEYPTTWGNPSSTTDIHPDGTKNYKISFSRLESTYICISNPSYSCSIDYAKSAEGYGILSKAGGTDYNFGIVLDSSKLPELCNDKHLDSNISHCHAGEFAADFSKILGSIQTE